MYVGQVAAACDKNQNRSYSYLEPVLVGSEGNQCGILDLMQRDSRLSLELVDSAVADRSVGVLAAGRLAGTQLGLATDQR